MTFNCDKPAAVKSVLGVGDGCCDFISRVACTKCDDNDAAYMPQLQVTDNY